MNYSQLKTAVSDWTHREDLATPAATFVQLAEARLLAELRLNRWTTTTTLTVPAGLTSVALPADFVEGRGLTGGSFDWTAVTPERLARLTEDGSETHSYSIFDGELHVPYAPTEDLELALTYYYAPEALSDSNTTNWVLTNQPAVYLFLALAEAALYVGTEAMTQKAAIYEGRARAAMDALRQLDSAGSTWAMSLPAIDVI